MVDYVYTVPGNVRGGGFILDPLTVNDFVRQNCDIVVHNESINDVTVPVYRISTGTTSGYSVVEVMELIDSPLIKNLIFGNNQIRYTQLDVEDITSIDDLNGVIVGIRYSDGKILYDTFESSNALLYDDDLTTLEGALTSITYDSTNYKITYNTVGEISE